MPDAVRREIAVARGWIVVVMAASISAFGCQARPAMSVQDGAQGMDASESRMASSTQVEFEDVLEIAQSNSPDAVDQLEQLRNRYSAESEIGRLVRRLLVGWDVANNTYRSSVPQLLENTCIDTEELKSHYTGEIEAKRLYLEIRVGANGIPVRASVIRGTNDGQLKDAVVHSLMGRRYVPAKPENDYVDATLTVECRLEVR